MNLGVLVPDEGFLPELSRLCRKHGTLLILDEVATGFGRTGTLFATEQFGVRPDMIVLAKAITDGVGGLGAMIAGGKVARSMEKDGAFYSTYGWHPRSVEAAIATLRYILKNERRLLGMVWATSEYFAERLGEMAMPCGAEVRIFGLAMGIDFGDEKYASRLAKKCRARGLLVSPEGGTVLLIPALNVDRATAAKGLDILAGCL
jgi:acetylornithine/succinyldiaminopimelate/putrescine aminotransferase